VIRVVLPARLRVLARTADEVLIDVAVERGGQGQHGVAGGGGTQRQGDNHQALPTQRLVLDALEASYPMLRGTIRDPATGRRRAFIRFFACEQDLSNQPPDTPLPEAVATGAEPFLVVGAMAGG
jgi:sulfur-carrier protein